jgi:hypothetical protein
MASWTSADVEALEGAYKTGALRVKTADKDVTFRSLAELRAVLQQLRASVAGRSPRRMTYADYDGGRV